MVFSQKKDIVEQSFEVNGVCKMCKARIEKTACKQKGVKNAEWDINNHLLTVLYDKSKIDINKIKIEEDLEENWAVVAEAIQTILRREKISNPYELLKDLTRGNKEIDKESIKKFINKRTKIDVYRVCI